MFLMKEIIAKKRDKLPLSEGEIGFFVKGVVDGSVSNEQVGAFAMAIVLNGLTMDEQVHLTVAMRDSGDVLTFDNLNDKPIVDKHSTGGVSDAVSLALAPIVAAAGAYVPMVSGKGLGHTGGTVDKLDAIPGYNTAPTIDEFTKVVKGVGCAIIGQTKSLAPADQRVYAIRDATATVASIPLIASSILSKKLASGVNYLVMDVKTGNGAFMQTTEEATDLAESIVGIANGAGVKTTAVISDMNEGLGRNIGNALEVAEIIQYLTNEKVDHKMDSIVRTLAQKMLVVAGIAPDDNEAAKVVDKVITTGKAAETFQNMVHAMGGNANILTNYEKVLPKSKLQTPVYLDAEGFVEKIDTTELGMLLVHLGGGRKNAGDTIDYSVGLEMVAKIGERVDANNPVATIHHNTTEQLNNIKHKLNTIFTVTNKTVKRNQTIIYKEIQP